MSQKFTYFLLLFFAQNTYLFFRTIIFFRKFYLFFTSIQCMLEEHVKSIQFCKPSFRLYKYVLLQLDRRQLNILFQTFNTTKIAFLKDQKISYVTHWLPQSVFFFLICFKVFLQKGFLSEASKFHRLVEYLQNMNMIQTCFFRKMYIIFVFCTMLIHGYWR